ncbi:LuxR C-terminal-related transcriptional regulator [Streptomyces sp. PSAA01]|uniref:LuxR C-terminal-related transcriptional regulator n=1 Tax=Streptomyces sp. PSAA01 TaxID=2912762 RepID=UPI001F00F63A|nr:LuxR C-terminal-related transcriptional regulator [Streptomyces sp. PSAA01]MCG0285336.1 LuxR C-terminal-related transcriptional regulator [Streptomyces sp. PSAA01]
MTPRMTTSAPITPLTPTQQRVAQHLVDGLGPQEIATRTGLSAVTVRQYVRDIRESLHCPPRCKPPVIVHFLCNARQVAPPTTDRPMPELSPEQQLLLRAVAEHSNPSDIAAIAKIASADVRAAHDELLDKTGAANTTQLVVWAHAWGLLGAGRATTMESRASQ